MIRRLFLLSLLVASCTTRPLEPASTPQPRGELRLAVAWPRSVQLVPDDTTAVGLVVSNGAVTQSLNLERATGPVATASFLLPEGAFEVRATAYRTGGTATAEGTASARVQANQATQAVVSMQPLEIPALGWYQPNGGPGQSIDLYGRHLLDPGRSLQATFNGVPAAGVGAWSDERASVVVPDGARNGPLIVDVNGVSSAAYAFQVISAVSLVGTSSVVLRPSAGILAATLVATASDTSGAAVSVPFVAWSATAPIVDGNFTPRFSAATGSVTTFTIEGTPATYAGTLSVSAGRVTAAIPYTIEP